MEMQSLSFAPLAPELAVHRQRDPAGEDLQRVLLAGGAEVREGPRRDEVGEGVERRPLARVVEGHLAAVHVQNDADHLRALAHGERLPRRRAGLVLAVAEADAPEALGRRQHVLALPVDGLAGHAHHPVGVVVDLHLPAVAAAGVALHRQHLGADVEALGVVGQLEDLAAVLHQGEVLGEQEAAGRRVWIQDDRVLAWARSGEC